MTNPKISIAPEQPPSLYALLRLSSPSEGTGRPEPSGPRWAVRRSAISTHFSASSALPSATATRIGID